MMQGTNIITLCEEEAKRVIMEGVQKRGWAVEGYADESKHVVEKFESIDTTTGETLTIYLSQPPRPEPETEKNA